MSFLCTSYGKWVGCFGNWTLDQAFAVILIFVFYVFISCIAFYILVNPGQLKGIQSVLGGATHGAQILVQE